MAPEDLRLRFFSGCHGVEHDELVRLVHPDAAVEVAFIIVATQMDAPPRG